MRIVAGIWRGRTVFAPAGDATRPTTDRVRESLMSTLFSLRGGFDGVHVLDAFAGSGALGFEALSRGAADAAFFDVDPAAVAAMKKTAASLGASPRAARISRGDVLRGAAGRPAHPYDLVFLDPPYRFAAADVLSFVAGLRSGGALDAGALVVYEHDAKDQRSVDDAANAAGLVVARSRKYRDTVIDVMRPAGPDAAKNDGGDAPQAGSESEPS